MEFDLDPHLAQLTHKLLSRHLSKLAGPAPLPALDPKPSEHANFFDRRNGRRELTVSRGDACVERAGAGRLQHSHHLDRGTISRHAPLECRARSGPQQGHPVTHSRSPVARLRGILAGSRSIRCAKSHSAIIYVMTITSSM
jgi:hypothetical protein